MMRWALDRGVGTFAALKLGLTLLGALVLLVRVRCRWMRQAVLALAAAAVCLKLVILLLLGRLFRLCREDGWVFAMSISQVGEFAFVLLAQAGTSGVLSPAQAALANAVVAVSMLSTPLLFVLFDRVLQPLVERAIGEFGAACEFGQTT